MAKVVALSNGLFCIVFIGNSGTVCATDHLLGKCYSNSGTVAANELILFSTPSSVFSEIQVIALTSDRFIISWSNDPAESNADVYFRVFTSSLVLVTGTTRINTSYLRKDQGYPSMAVNTFNGITRFFATYSSYGNGGSDDSAWAVIGKIYNSDMTVYSSDRLVNTYKPGDQFIWKPVALSN